jgi:hypothetical protein
MSGFEGGKIVVSKEVHKLSIKNIWDYLGSRRVDANTYKSLARDFGVSERFARIAVEKYREWDSG